MAEDKIPARVDLRPRYSREVAAAMLEGAGRTLERVARDLAYKGLDLEAVRAAHEVTRWVLASEKTGEPGTFVKTYAVLEDVPPFEVDSLLDAVALAVDNGGRLSSYGTTWWVEQHAYSADGEPIGEVAVYDADVTAAYRELEAVRHPDDVGALPCVECGTPVDAPVHREEYGMCLTCSNNYWEHKGETR